MPKPLAPEIVQEAVRGSSRAFREIVETHQGFVYAVAFRFVRNAQDAEDIAQDVFIRLWKNLNTYRPEIKLTTWLHKIVTNCCLDFLKSRHGRQRKNSTDLDKEQGMHASSTTPEREYQQQELSKIIYQAAEELTPKQRAVFILRDLEGLSPEEVSNALTMSIGNVKSNLFHARKKITEKLKLQYQTTDKQFL